MVRHVTKPLLVVVSCLVGFLICEIGYRVYLYTTEPYQFMGDRNVWYFQASPYRYSEEFGFEYVPGSYSGGAAYEGRVIECWDRMEEWEFNELGNSGRIKGSYKDAKLKILAFGDSFTQRARLAPNGDYMTWPDFLQDALEKELGISANVVNFGRDAYGVLQMFDLAAAKIRDWRPDLAIIAFITDDLTRGRFWRTTTFLDGRERILTSTSRDVKPSWETATDAYILERKATQEWCHTALKSGVKDDPIVLELEQTLIEGSRRSTLLADPFSFGQSFVLDKIVHKNAYYSTYEAARPSQLPRHQLTDFVMDERLVANIDALRQLGIPYILVHLATYREMSRGKEYSAGDERDDSLVQGLARLTGHPIHGTLENIGPVEDLQRVRKSRSDEHPSLYGHQFYAQVILNALRRNRYLDTR